VRPPVGASPSPQREKASVLARGGESRPPRAAGDGQLVVDEDGGPAAVEEEAQAVAARLVDGGHVLGEEARDEVVALGDHGERGHEPAVAHAALPQVGGTEAEVGHHRKVREARPPVRLILP
jgi:hypothetical protein